MMAIARYLVIAIIAWVMWRKLVHPAWIRHQETSLRRMEMEKEARQEELAARKAAYVQPEPNIKTGWLARYACLVTSANLGAVLK